MLVAPAPAPSAFSYASPSTTLEDILDLTQFEFGSASPSSNSCSSSHSPSSSTNALPTTPPQLSPPATFALESDLFYRSYLASKSPTLPQVTTPPPELANILTYSDLFSSYAAGALRSQEPIKRQSPDFFPSLFSTTTSGIAPQQSLSIDPQLVESLATTSPSTSFTHTPTLDDDHDIDDDEDEDEDEEEPESIILKVAKSKGRNKPVVASGGIVKKSFASSIKDKDSDDWRPSPEEYKKLSSKEKRQLRNKISARNFRVRRKGAFYFFLF